MAVKTVQVPAKQCECNLCGHEWITLGETPVICPGCRSRRWNGEKKMEEVSRRLLVEGFRVPVCSLQIMSLHQQDAIAAWVRFIGFHRVGKQWHGRFPAQPKILSRYEYVGRKNSLSPLHGSEAQTRKPSTSAARTVQAARKAVP